MHGAVRAPPYDALTADHALVQRVTCIRKRYDIVGILRAPYIDREGDVKAGSWGRGGARGGADGWNPLL